MARALAPFVVTRGTCRGTPWLQPWSMVQSMDTGHGTYQAVTSPTQLSVDGVTHRRQ